MDLIYEIDLGEKAKIAKIEFIGDKIYKDSKLGNIILSEETRPWKFISRRKFLDERRISSDQRLLEVFYKNNGYYDVKINTTNINYLENKGFVDNQSSSPLVSRCCETNTSSQKAQE